MTRSTRTSRAPCEGGDRAHRPAEKAATDHKWLGLGGAEVSVEELETLPAGTEPGTPDRLIDRMEDRASVERGGVLTICLERTREGHREMLKGNVGKTSERRGGAHMGFSELN